MNASNPRCLVLQMARLGDTLQSLMALRAAKQLYPTLEIHVLAREEFAEAARKVPWIKNVIALPTDALVLPVAKGSKSEADGVADIARWIAPIVREPWDFLVNWTYSESSSYLAALIPAKVRLGYSRRPDGTLAALDGWSHYVQAMIQGGVPQNIHLTDVFTTQLLTALQIHVGEPNTEAGNDPLTSKTFFSLQVQRERLSLLRESSRRWVGIQLGAANAAKTWDPENWASVANLVLHRHPEYNIVLFGGKSDQQRVDRFMAAFGAAGGAEERVLSFVGKTDFDLWATLIGKCSWVFSGDTAAVHLASILGTRVLNVSVGPVRWSETGPYGNGHYVVSSHLFCEACENYSGDQAGDNAFSHLCRAHVSPEAVYATWAYGASEWAHRRQVPIEEHFSRLGWSKKLETVQVHRSRIRGTDDGGGVVYDSQVERPMTLTTWTSQAVGTLARAWYCGWVPTLGKELERWMISPQLVSSLRALDESASVLEKICGEAHKAARTLQRRSLSLRSDRVMGVKDREEISTLGKQLLELDELIERLGATEPQPTMSAFSKMAKVLMHNLRGDQLSELGRESALSYEQLGQGATLLRDWIKATLKVARPMMVVARSPSTAAPDAGRVKDLS